MKHILITAILVCHAALVAAQGSLEVIPLRHRSAEQVIPVLRPLMDAGGVLSGQGYQLFVRTSPRNLADLRRTLAAIDTPQRRLVVSVRFDSGAQAAGGGVEARGALRSGGLSLDAGHAANVRNAERTPERAQTSSHSRIEARVTASRSAGAERIDQRVQVLDGGRAFISTGQSRPVQQQQVFSGPGGTQIQQTTLMQYADTGFTVVPRLSGETVFLEISPQRATFDTSQPGAPVGVQSQQVSSEVGVRLGEWVELGGVFASAAGSERGVLSSRGAGVSASRRVWVKVEALQP